MQILPAIRDDRDTRPALHSAAHPLHCRAIAPPNALPNAPPSAPRTDPPIAPVRGDKTFDKMRALC